MNSPFDALHKLATGDSGESFSRQPQEALPSYLLAADAHNIAGDNGFSFTDPQEYLDLVSNSGKFFQTAVISGALSIYNSGVAIGNLFGTDIEELDTHATITSYDDDLGRYYEENKFGADLVGFIAGSFIPGTLGLKALKAAKAGYVGANMSKATNLLSPNVDNLILEAGKELVQSKAMFSALQSGSIKAFGGGVRGAVTESLVAETFIAATMFRSPILEDMDVYDLTANVMLGGAIGGVIGGGISAARIVSGVKKFAGGGDLDLRIVDAIDQLPESFAPSERLIVALNNRDRVATAKVVSEKVTADTVAKARAQTLSTLDTDARTYTNQMARGDNELGNILYDSIKQMKTVDAEDSFFGVTSVARLGKRTPEEAAIAKRAEEITKARLSILDEVPKPVPEQEFSLSYVKLAGEGRGTMTTELPAVRTLADVVESPAQIMQRVKNQGFKAGKTFSLVEAAKDILKVDARYIWASRVAKVTAKMRLGADDIPMLERSFREYSDLAQKAKALDKPAPEFSVVIELGKGKTKEITDLPTLYAEILRTKDEVAEKLLKKGKLTTDEIAAITNVRREFLEGTRTTEVDDYFARQTQAEKYTKELIEKKLWKAKDGLYPLDLKPSYAKISYDLNQVGKVDGHQAEAMAVIQQKYKLYAEGVDRAIASSVGSEMYNQIVSITDRELLQANRNGAQSGLISFANANYDSIGAKVQYLGAVTARLEKKFMDETLDTVNPAGLKLLANPEAAIEFATINQKIQGSAEHYVLLPDGSALIPRKLANYEAELELYEQLIEEGAKAKPPKPPVLAEGTLEEIAIHGDDTLEAVRAHIKANGNRVAKEKNIRAAQGLESHIDPETFYPIRKNYRDYQHFAFVVDETITGTGHVSMIHAATPEALEALIGKVPPQYAVHTKSAGEAYHKALGEYEFARTLNENYIDTSLVRKGVDSDFFVQTDPQKIVDTWVQDLTRRDRVLAKEIVRAKNEKQFLELEKLGESYTGIAASKYASSLAKIEDTVKNPYANYIKTALNISTIAEHPLLVGFNNIMDKAFSTVARALDDTIGEVNDVKDLAKINTILQRYGAKSAYYDAATNLLANHSAPKGVLTDFIRNANSIIATLVLRTDPSNAFVNAIGSNVLLGGELSYLINAIKRGDKEAVGRLTQLANIKIPGTDQSILSPQKLIGNAIKRFVQGDAEMTALYKANGWNARVVEQFRSMMEDLSLKGTEDVVQLENRMGAAIAKFKEISSKSADTLEKFSGNRLAEEYNRFVAADVMKQITDLAVSNGIMKADEALANINTFVNRTQGNILASQRPLIFQGPVGSALGLFQTYQLNLMQQLFRYVGEGTAKDTAMLLGLQGTIFGMNGMPGFNAINTHLIGTASGNTKHTDLYDATYNTAGKEIGDWLMFGAASNLPKIANVIPGVDGVGGTNVFVRGDINPRQLTIVPINPVDFPAVNAIGKVYNNLSDVASKILTGAKISETLLQAVEHNGFSRPLAGLAQVAQSLGGNGNVYATDSKGSILGTNDLLSFNSLIRVAGAKPLDEAIINDRFFTTKAYAAKDKARMDAVRESVRTGVIQGNTLGENEISRFAYEYAKAGGKQKNFNKFVMNQYLTANTPAAERLANDLSNPFSQTMQRVMGGRDMTEGSGE